MESIRSRELHAADINALKGKLANMQTQQRVGLPAGASIRRSSVYYVR